MNTSQPDTSGTALAEADAGEGVHDSTEDLDLYRRMMELRSNMIDVEKEPPSNLTTAYIGFTARPPEGYTIGDAYLKHELASEAKKLEEKVNRHGTNEKGLEKRRLFLDDALGMERDGWDWINALGRVIMNGAQENYAGRMAYASKEYEKHCERMGEIKRRICTLDEDANGPVSDSSNKGTNIMHRMMLAHAETVKELKAEYSAEQKKAFEAYTKLIVFTCYSSRIQHELQRMVMGEPSEEFRMLMNSDQLL